MGGLPGGGRLSDKIDRSLSRDHVPNVVPEGGNQLRRGVSSVRIQEPSEIASEGVVETAMRLRLSDKITD